MINATEARRMSDEVEEKEVFRAMMEAKQTCETVIAARIEEAARNGYTVAFHASDEYQRTDKLFYKAVKEYLIQKGYMVTRQTNRTIAINW